MSQQFLLSEHTGSRKDIELSVVVEFDGCSDECLLGWATGDEDSTVAFWVSTSDFATQNPEVMQAWRTSISEALELIADDEAGSRQKLQEWLGVSDAVAMGAPMPAMPVELKVEYLAPHLVISEEMGGIEKCTIDLDPLVWP